MRKVLVFVLAFSTLLGAAVYAGSALMNRPDIIVLTLGEPYEQVRQQSKSTLPRAEPTANWMGVVTRPAKLQFSDQEFGFVTPPAKFFAVVYDDKGKVESVTLSPQVVTLTLSDAMAILADLQDQLRRGGWKPFREARSQPIDDTPATRAEIRKCVAPTSYWQAEAKYQLSLNIRCFRSEDHPNDERYLITLDLGPPVFDDSPAH